MNKRYFKFAREAAMSATYQGSHNFAPKIGVCILYKGSIVATASNSDKTSPLQARYNIYRFEPANTLDKVHAEVAAIQKIRWRFGDSIEWDKVELYIYREYKDGRLALGRCCPSCMRMLQDLGVRKIYYTTEYGYAKEILEKKINNI